MILLRYFFHLTFGDASISREVVLPDELLLYGEPLLILLVWVKRA